MKSEIERNLDQAHQRARAARARVLATIGEVRHRIDPRVVASEAADAAFAKVDRLVSTTANVAKARPWLLAGGATLFGLALTLRTRWSSGAEPAETEATNAEDESLSAQAGD